VRFHPGYDFRTTGYAIDPAASAMLGSEAVKAHKPYERNRD